MTIDTKALLPCPFCGGEPAHKIWSDHSYHEIECSECGVGDSYHRGYEHAVAAWNRRHGADRLAALEAEIQQLRAELAQVRVLCPEVIAFAQLMQRKLDLNKHKPSWKGDSAYTLLERLFEEAVELHEALENGTDEAVGLEAADVCGALSQPAEQLTAAASVDDMAMIIRQLVLATRKVAPDNTVSARAVDYLERHGLSGSPLREQDQLTEPYPSPANSKSACRSQSEEFDEQLPLMARQDWMDDAIGVMREDPGRHDWQLYYENDQALMLQDAAAGLEVYRVADTDEHGLPVIERTAEMPREARYTCRNLLTKHLLWSDIYQPENGLEWQRIEDFHPATPEAPA